MLKLYHELQQRGMWRLFDELEAPLSVILALLELRGVHVNADVMHRSRDALQVCTVVAHSPKQGCSCRIGFLSVFNVKPENVKNPHAKFLWVLKNPKISTFRLTVTLSQQIINSCCNTIINRCLLVWLFVFVTNSNMLESAHGYKTVWRGEGCIEYSSCISRLWFCL